VAAAQPPVPKLTCPLGWFTEGFDTLDLKEAKALLDGCTPDNQFRNGLEMTLPRYLAGRPKTLISVY